MVHLAGCGAMQTVKEATINTTKAIFIADTLTLKIDLLAREGMNADDKDQATPVVIRIYQLKDAKTFAAGAYTSMLDNDTSIIKDDLLQRKDLVLRPGASISLDEPLEKNAKAVGVAAFFRTESRERRWQIVVPRDALSDDHALKIEVIGSELKLAVPAKG
ncbi:type VI secretion system lipoprotein TssJ [Silvimonas soli]|nr:type VI secretion system lipoprotein TssJ [Silvimonas soli]MDR3428728.1 type VI secretion system lipoprotein TssJ [Silvimonas sp.]